MNPTSEPVIVDCPAGYQCRLLIEAVPPAEFGLYVMGIIAAVIIIVAILIFLNERGRAA